MIHSHFLIYRVVAIETMLWLSLCFDKYFAIEYFYLYWLYVCDCIQQAWKCLISICIERKNILNRKNDSIFWVQLKSGDECDSQNFTHFNAIAQVECISSECEMNGLKCWLFQLHFILIKAPENWSCSRGAPSHNIYSTFIIECILIFVYF